jgi:hypothetical protein
VRVKSKEPSNSESKRVGDGDESRSVGHGGSTILEETESKGGGVCDGLESGSFSGLSFILIILSIDSSLGGDGVLLIDEGLMDNLSFEVKGTKSGLEGSSCGVVGRGETDDVERCTSVIVAELDVISGTVGDKVSVEVSVKVSTVRGSRSRALDTVGFEGLSGDASPVLCSISGVDEVFVVDERNSCQTRGRVSSFVVLVDEVELDSVGDVILNLGGIGTSLDLHAVPF